MTTLAIGVGALAAVALLVGCAWLALRPDRAGRSDDPGSEAGSATPGPGSGRPSAPSGPRTPPAGQGPVPGAGPPGPPRRATNGRSLPSDLAAPRGGLVLLQLSSAFSGSCRDARAVLDDVAAELPGVSHRDLDLATRPELVRMLGVADTPTTLVVDASGVELLRIAGVPRRAALVSALTPHLPRT